MIKKHPQSLLLFLLLSWSAPALASYNATTHTYEWTDDLRSTQTAGVTGDYDQSPKVQTKAAHMLELKDAIDQVAPLCGASNIWTAYDLQVLSQVRIGSKVSKEQLNTLRKGIRSLYSAKGQTAPSSVADLNTNTPTRIQKSHIQDMRDAINAVAAICAAGGSPRTPVCWTLSGPECDIYSQPGCSNARMCGVYSYSDGSQETDMAPCDAPPNGPPPGWVTCGGGAACVPDGTSCGAVGQETLCQTNCCSNKYTITGEPESPPSWAYICGSAYACGNGFIEPGEQCDDHNTTNGDGCSSTCQTEGCVANGTICGLTGVISVGVPSNCNQCCSGNSDCSGGGSIPTGTCVCSAPAAATCSDGIQNQGETGVDCGGPCAACGGGFCSDGIQNHGEEAVDCGGACPPCFHCTNTACDWDGGCTPPGSFCCFTVSYASPTDVSGSNDGWDGPGTTYDTVCA